MKVRFVLHTGFAGCVHEESVDLSDNLTDDQIEEEWKDWAWNQIEGYWEVEE